MRCTRRPKSTYCKPFQEDIKRGEPEVLLFFLWRLGGSARWRRSSKGGTYAPPALDGLECGLRLAKSRRYAAVARWTPAAAGVRGHTAHKRRPFAPSCESPPLPSGRAARAKVSLAFAVPPGCLDRASRTDARPCGKGTAAPRGVEPALPAAYGGWAAGGRRHALCARSAPLFAAANAENLSSFRLAAGPARKRRWGDSQEGRNLGSSPLVCLRRIAANMQLRNIASQIRVSGKPWTPYFSPRISSADKSSSLQIWISISTSIFR